MIPATMEALLKMSGMAFVFGIFLGVIYDIVRISRAFVGISYNGKSADKLYQIEYPLIGKLRKNDRKKGKIFYDIYIAIGDFFYCAFVGIASCIFLYYTNNGMLRLPAVFMAFMGLSLYYRTIGRFIVNLAEILCIFLKIITKFLLFAIAFPLKVMYNILIMLSKKIFGVPVNALLAVFRAVNTRRKLKAIREEATFGFIKKYLKGQDI